jgi:hypothetical protein
MTLATTSNRELCARAKRHWTAQQMVFYVVSEDNRSTQAGAALTNHSTMHLAFEPGAPMIALDSRSSLRSA